jgi:hypothetical protein
MVSLRPSSLISQSSNGGKLLFWQHEVQQPAAPYLLAGLAAMIQDFRVRAADIFQSIGEDGHPMTSSWPGSSTSL